MFLIYAEVNMRNHQHPIRNVREEVYDRTLSYEQRTELEQAYRELFANLLPNEVEELEDMLL
jgi:hypothetical protein